MDTTLFLIPSIYENSAVVGEHDTTFNALFAGARTFFYYDTNNILELRQLLIQNTFTTVLVCFPSLGGAIPEMGAIRSLALGSTIVLYCPDLTPLRSVRDMAANRKDDVFKWHCMGQSILLNLCRQSDMVMPRCAEDEHLLREELPDVSLLSITQALEKKDAPVFVKKKKKKVSIIMLTFNQLADTRQCVESLVRYTPGDYELIFVDNGSVDETRAYLEDLKGAHDNVRLIINQENVGFSKANNQGMRIATGEYLLLLNNDVILTAGWLERLLACIDSDPFVGVVGPSTNHAVGQQVIYADMEFDHSQIQKFACLNAMKNPGYWFEVHRIIGFCMLIKREVIERIGMLDERFGPGGFEDYDFCLRVKQGGYRIMIAGEVFVYHIGGRGYSTNNLDYNKLRQKNVQIFIDKWCRKALETMEVIPF